MTQIKATILADSISPTGKRITSFELELPRFIWAEMLTHRQFSRNAASSRAIPVTKANAQVKSNPALPVMWGANQRGMQSETELTGIKLHLAKFGWNISAYIAGTMSNTLARIGLHKQYANRISEYAQVYKVVLTATEFENFFYLRSHADAQPEIKALSDAMYAAREASTPIVLYPGEYHLPYVTTERLASKDIQYKAGDTILTVDQAIMVSSSACAQVSYRVLDLSLDKAIDIYQRLVDSKPVHASPFEHQATPMQTPVHIPSHQIWEHGVTHCDHNNNLWSGNFQGWIQHRQLIPENVYTGN